LRRGAWAELQDNTSLQSSHTQSNLLLPMSPSAVGLQNISNPDDVIAPQFQPSRPPPAQ